MPNSVEVSGDGRQVDQLRAYNDILAKARVGAPLDEMLTDLTLATESCFEGLLASVLLVDDSGKHLVAGAAPSLPDFYNDAIDGIEIGDGIGSCGTAAATGKAVIVSDVQTHPNWEAFRELAAKAGLRACWSQPILAAEGAVLGTFAMYYSVIKEPSEAEQESIRLAANIAASFIGRYRAEAALDAARLEAVRANEAKSRFLANVSHELRTPLNAIVVTLDMLDQDTLSAEARELVHTATDSCATLKSTVDDLLDVRRREEGRLSLHLAPTELTGLLRRMEKVYRPLASSQGLTLDFEGPADDLWILGDEMRLRQIVANLVSNAIKYTVQGTVTLHLSAAPLADRALTLTIRVSDTGLGISRADQKHLFDRFQRVDDSRTRTIEGSGLGLSICKELVGLMNGTITVDSEVGKGSSFEVCLTVTTCDPALSETQAPDAGPHAPMNGRKHRILLAEDNPVNQLLISKFLEFRGAYDCTVAGDGRAVLDALNGGDRARFDLILMDIHMPDTDGITLTRQIRSSRTSYADIPIVALTADTFETTRQACHDAGMNGFLTKPIEKDRMFGMLHDFLAETA